MKRLLTTIAALAILPILGAASSEAQSMEDLNLQIHGYATQGFLYSTHNNWNTTDSSDGSAAWTEAVVNLTAQPQSKLRIGVQARYDQLGDYGNAITLDWAQLDYKINEKIGVRAGKAKTPLGLFNGIQDIDPAQLWILLPQSIYPITSRNATLAHYGGVVYGSLPIGEKFGTLEYHGFGGQRVVGSQDGFLEPVRDYGATAPNGVTGPTFGGSLQWNTPVAGLIVGGAESSGTALGAIQYGPYPGTYSVPRFRETIEFVKYEHKRLMVAAEYNRWLAVTEAHIPGVVSLLFLNDKRPWYAMAS